MNVKHLEGRSGSSNNLPLYGVSMAIAEFCLVSPWYENGTIMEYLKKKPDANRFELVSTLGQTHTPDADLHPQTAIRCS